MKKRNHLIDLFLLCYILAFLFVSSSFHLSSSLFVSSSLPHSLFHHIVSSFIFPISPHICYYLCMYMWLFLPPSTSFSASFFFHLLSLHLTWQSRSLMVWRLLWEGTKHYLPIFCNRWWWWRWWWKRNCRGGWGIMRCWVCSRWSLASFPWQVIDWWQSNNMLFG